MAKCEAQLRDSTWPREIGCTSLVCTLLPFSPHTDLKPVVADSELQAWREEVDAHPSLRTYAQVKVRLELEAYLRDDGGVATVAGRRAAMDMARLRCATHPLAISEGRREHRPVVLDGSGGGGQQRGGPPQLQRVPVAERVCEWCKQRLTQPDAAHLGGPAMAPVEDEEHALLWCGLYADSRTQLFERVRELTSGKTSDGKGVLKQGPVDLHALTRSPRASEGDMTAALAIVMGGLGATSRPDRRRGSAQQRSRASTTLSDRRARRTWVASPCSGGGGGSSGWVEHVGALSPPWWTGCRQGETPPHLRVGVAAHRRLRRRVLGRCVAGVEQLVEAVGMVLAVVVCGVEELDVQQGVGEGVQAQVGVTAGRVWRLRLQVGAAVSAGS